MSERKFRVESIMDEHGKVTKYTADRQPSVEEIREADQLIFSRKESDVPTHEKGDVHSKDNRQWVTFNGPWNDYEDLEFSITEFDDSYEDLYG